VELSVTSESSRKYVRLIALCNECSYSNNNFHKLFYVRPSDSLWLVYVILSRLNSLFD